jgi:hypothetical protein
MNMGDKSPRLSVKGRSLHTLKGDGDDTVSSSTHQIHKRPVDKTFAYPAEGILPPCKVCVDKASGYHFGAVTCEACKVFFHRSLGRDKDYRCKTKTKKCEVTHMKKPICAYCRLAKCYSLGMGKDGVKRGRYSLETRTEHILEAKAYDSNSPPEITPTSRTTDEIQKIEKLIDDVYENFKNNLLYSPELLNEIPKKHKDHLERLKHEEETFGSLIPLDLYQDIKSVTGVEIDDRKQRLNKCITSLDKEFYVYINAFRNMPGFSELHYDDRVTLTRDNRFKWFCLAILPGVDTDLKLYTCPSCEQTMHMREMEIHFNYDYVSEKFRISKILKQIKMTDQEIAMVQAIVLLATDDVTQELKDPKTIRELSDDYTDALVYLVKTTSPQDTMRIPKIVNALTEIRTSSHLYSKVMCSFKRDFPEIEVSELFKEMSICGKGQNNKNMCNEK